MSTVEPHFRIETTFGTSSKHRSGLRAWLYGIYTRSIRAIRASSNSRLLQTTVLSIELTGRCAAHTAMFLLPCPRFPTSLRPNVIDIDLLANCRHAITNAHDGATEQGSQMDE